MCACMLDHNLCYFVAECAVFMQKMFFVAVLLYDFYANFADIMQVVLLLCKLWVFYANSAVLMQIVLFWCKLWHLHFTIYAVLSQMTFLSRNTRFNSRHFWVCYQALNTFNDVCRQPCPTSAAPQKGAWHWYAHDQGWMQRRFCLAHQETRCWRPFSKGQHSRNASITKERTKRSRPGKTRHKPT